MEQWFPWRDTIENSRTKNSYTTSWDTNEASAGSRTTAVTVTQGLRRCGLRRTRYRGLDKTGFQYILTAAALDLIRTDQGSPKPHSPPPGPGASLAEDPA